MSFGRMIGWLLVILAFISLAFGFIVGAITAWLCAILIVIVQEPVMVKAMKDLSLSGHSDNGDGGK